MQACQRSNHDRDKECSDAHLDFHAPNGKSMVLGSQSFCYSASSNIGAATKLFEELKTRIAGAFGRWRVCEVWRISFAVTSTG